MSDAVFIALAVVVSLAAALIVCFLNYINNYMEDSDPYRPEEEDENKY